MQNGLKDFFILEGFKSALTGFYDGTENVNDSLGSSNATFKGKDGFLGITSSGKQFRFDGDERILNPKHNAMLGGMSNNDLVKNALIGSHMGDYLPPQYLSNKDLFDKQKESFVSAVNSRPKQGDSNGLVITELRQLNRRLAAQPNISIEIRKVYKNIYDIIETEVKEGLKKTTTKRLK